MDDMRFTEEAITATIDDSQAVMCPICKQLCMVTMAIIVYNIVLVGHHYYKITKSSSANVDCVLILRYVSYIIGTLM